MMERPSRTAFAAACHRATHQILDQGIVFADPLAVKILGADAETALRAVAGRPSGRGLRFYLASRTRFAEDALKTAVEVRRVRQLVVLGAGLDTFAYRHPLAHRLRMFEVDHPATQAWKKRLLRQSFIAVPSALTFVPVDFERDSLSVSLKEAGFDPHQRTFFTWLGVVPYLSREAVFATLGLVAGLPGGAEIVFDYGNPLDTLSAKQRLLHEELADRVATVGEPFLSYFDTAALHPDLAELGLTEINDYSTTYLVACYMSPPYGIGGRPNNVETAAERGGHVIWAATPPK